MKKENQISIKLLLIVQTLLLVVYTMYVGINEGWIFVSVAINNIKSLGWNGQFTLDFSCYLMLSAFWIAWRNKYTAQSIFIAIVAYVLGIVVFAPYLLYLLFKEEGNIKKMLVGDRI
jgi:hypothetical protein